MGKTEECALQHIKVFREQSSRNETADFGEPCQKCIHTSECNFDWFSILSPLAHQSRIEISMAVREPILPQGTALTGIVTDTDIQSHEDKKNE